MHICHQYKKRDEDGNETLKEHKNLLNEHGEVWWALFHEGDKKSPMGGKKIKRIERQLKNKQKTNVLLTTKNGDRRWHIGLLEDIKYFENGGIPANKSLIPDYYRDEEYEIWFKFTRIIDSINEYEIKSTGENLIDFLKKGKGKRKPILYLEKR